MGGGVILQDLSALQGWVDYLASEVPLKVSGKEVKYFLHLPYRSLDSCIVSAKKFWLGGVSDTYRLNSYSVNPGQSI